MLPGPNGITALLARWNEGDRAALDLLAPLVYQQLHRMAAAHMRGERSGHPLQTTALVHEAYLRLHRHDAVRWHNRGHFYAMASRVMRHVLVDYARARRQQKRDAGREVGLDEALMISSARPLDVIALDEALTDLASLDPRQSRVVELRFFGGLTEQEIADVLNVSPRTVSSDWRLARAWLLRELTRSRDA
jgi:RNA polymerase sigma factor (TIGR02999 family)